MKSLTKVFSSHSPRRCWQQPVQNLHSDQGDAEEVQDQRAGEEGARGESGHDGFKEQVNGAGMCWVVNHRAM